MVDRISLVNRVKSRRVCYLLQQSIHKSITQKALMVDIIGLVNRVKSRRVLQVDKYYTVIV